MSILDEANKLNQEIRVQQAKDAEHQTRTADYMCRVLGDTNDLKASSLTAEQQSIIGEVVEAIPPSEWTDDATLETSYVYCNQIDYGGRTAAHKGFEIKGTFGVFTMYQWNDGSVYLRRKYGGSDNIIDRAFQALPPEYDVHKQTKWDGSYGGNIIDTVRTKTHNLKANKSAEILRVATLEKLRDYPVFGSRKYVGVWYYYDSDFPDQVGYFVNRKADVMRNTLSYVLFGDGHIFNFTNRPFLSREQWVELVRQWRS